MVISAAVHAALFLLWRGTPGPAAGEAAGASPRVEGPDAWRGVQAVAVRAEGGAEERPPARVEVDRAEPRVLERSRPRLTLRRVTTPPRAPVRLAAAGQGSGRQGQGSAPAGEGADSRGQGGGGGGDGGLSPPVPRSLLPQWDPPKSVRGSRVTVRVEVDRSGRPTGNVVLEPPTPDGSFNRRLKRRMASLEFLPATRNGEPIAAWAEITFLF